MKLKKYLLSVCLVISYGKKVETEIASYVFVTSTIEFLLSTTNVKVYKCCFTFIEIQTYNSKFPFIANVFFYTYKVQICWSLFDNLRKEMVASQMIVETVYIYIYI